MPNWCNTYIDIQCKDENEAIYLYEKIKEWTSKDSQLNWFGTDWLGNVVAFSGINKDVECRGDIVYLGLVYNVVHIETETAWTPMMGVWVEVVDKYVPGASITYTAEEPGCGVYVTNDPARAKSYSVDIWDHDDFNMLETMEEGDVVEFIRCFMQTNEVDVDKLIQMANEEDGVSINKYEYQEPEIYY